jgi:hypothetical protein
MATLIGQSTGLWAQVEVQMALILSALMKSKSDAAVAFFLSIRNSRLQRDGLAAAATSVLKDENLDLFFGSNQKSMPISSLIYWQR